MQKQKKEKIMHTKDQLAAKAQAGTSPHISPKPINTGATKSVSNIVKSFEGEKTKVGAVAPPKPSVGNAAALLKQKPSTDPTAQKVNASGVPKLDLGSGKKKTGSSSTNGPQKAKKPGESSTSGAPKKKGNGSSKKQPNSEKAKKKAAKKKEKEEAKASKKKEKEEKKAKEAQIALEKKPTSVTKVAAVAATPKQAVQGALQKTSFMSAVRRTINSAKIANGSEQARQGAAKKRNILKSMESLEKKKQSLDPNKPEDAKKIASIDATLARKQSIVNKPPESQKKLNNLVAKKTALESGPQDAKTKKQIQQLDRGITIHTSILGERKKHSEDIIAFRKTAISKLDPNNPKDVKKIAEHQAVINRREKIIASNTPKSKTEAGDPALAKTSGDPALAKTSGDPAAAAKTSGDPAAAKSATPAVPKAQKIQGVTTKSTNNSKIAKSATPAGPPKAKKSPDAAKSAEAIAKIEATKKNLDTTDPAYAKKIASLDLQLKKHEELVKASGPTPPKVGEPQYISEKFSMNALNKAAKANVVGTPKTKKNQGAITNSSTKKKNIEGVTTKSTTNSKAPKPQSHENAQKAVNSITKKLEGVKEGTPEHIKLTSQL